jgi:hypothetical protein
MSEVKERLKRKKKMLEELKKLQKEIEEAGG